MRLRLLAFFLVLIFFNTQASNPDSTYRIFTENDLQGLQDAQGNVVIPAQFEELGWSHGSDAVHQETIGFRNESRWGLLSISGEVLIDASYTRLYPSGNNYHAGVPEKFFNRDLHGIIDEKNRVIIPLNYHSLERVGENYIAGKASPAIFNYGLIDSQDKVIVPLQFVSIHSLLPGLLSFENQEKKYAAYTDAGVALSAFVYDEIITWQGYLIVDQSGKKGLMDSRGILVYECLYKGYELIDGQVEAMGFPEWKVISSQNNIQNQLNYDSLQVFEKGLIVYANGIRSVMNNEFHFLETDSVHYSIHYDTLYQLDEFVIAGREMNDLMSWSVYDKDGHKISRKNYESIGNISEGLIAVKSDGFWGFIDQKGFEIIFNSYQSVSEFRNGLSIVEFHNQFGLVNHDGEWVCLPLYNSLSYAGERSYIYTKGLSYGIVDGYSGVVFKTGNKLIPFNGRILEINPESKSGLVDLNGKILFHTDYDSIIFSAESNHFILKKNGRYKLFNIGSGHRYNLDHNITEVYQPTEGYYGIKANKQYGFVDYEGKLRISNRYDSIMPVKNGLVPFMLRGKWGLLSLSERIIVQPLYWEVDPVSRMNVIVKHPDGYGILDHDGNTIIDARYEEIHAFERGDLRIRRDGKYGVVDPNGRVLINPSYEEILEVNGEHYRIKRRGKYGLINASGVSTIPPVYDELIYNPFSGLYFGKTKTASP